MAKQITSLFGIAKSPLPFKCEIFKEGTKIEVPFLLDNQGCSPLDLALGINTRLPSAPTGKAEPEVAAEQGDQFVDLELARIVLKNLTNT